MDYIPPKLLSISRRRGRPKKSEMYVNLGKMKGFPMPKRRRRKKKNPLSLK